MSRKVVIAAGQTIWDLAIQEGGSIEYVQELLKQNPNKLANLDAAPVAGDFLLVEADPVDKEVKGVFDRLFENKKMKAATLQDSIAEDGDVVEPTGDFNNDFNSDFNT